MGKGYDFIIRVDGKCLVIVFVVVNVDLVEFNKVIMEMIGEVILDILKCYLWVDFKF